MKKFKIFIGGHELPITVNADNFENAFYNAFNGNLLIVALTDYNSISNRVCYKCIRNTGFEVGKIIHVSIHEI